jgi:nephrocystin-3
MMRERDLLVKEVFPELRRKCARRRVVFTEVDLRWGITEEQAAEGQVLPLCLAEIERSRPYFVGLLGERYGWIPDTIRPEVIEREPWLREHVHGRTSVTELEILHGVLNNPEMDGHAFFYFRDPAYLDSPDLTDKQRLDLIERDLQTDVLEYGEAEATRRTAERKAKLAALKQRIRDSKLPLEEPYPDPKTLARLVRLQFSRLIDRLYPEDQVPDPLVQERQRHEAYAKSKLFGCIDRPAHMAALEAFVDRADTGGKGLVVTGESGGGKTALLAAWARDWAKDNPDAFFFQHYFGATPESASPEGFLRRLMGELRQRFGFTDEMPSNTEKLRDALPVWLAQTPADVQIALVLDGLNQVRGSEPDRRLLFLPVRFPPHITLVASALPGPALEALRKRGWSVHEVPKATEEEADAMAAEYFRLLGRHVDADGQPINTALRRQLVASPGTRNPLFLRTVLEELRQFGDFEKLPERVSWYLEAHDPKELLRRVIQRWQGDFDHPDPGDRAHGLTRRALAHLWAARQGLSESEWLDLLGWKPQAGDASPLPRAPWTPLFLAMEPHLCQRDGLFAYGHDFLRQAVEEMWVSTAELRQAEHLSIANYFERHPNQSDMTPRKAAEWPFQLHAAESWERLEACLTCIPLFLELCGEETRWELTGYWHPLRSKPLGRDMGACYTAAFGAWASGPAHNANHCVPEDLGLFLVENGLYTAAEPLLRRTLEASERFLGAEHPSTLRSANNLARLLEGKGDYADAEPLHRRALEASERVLGAEHPNTLVSVNNLAALLYGKGDYAGAELLFRRALEAHERVLGAEHPNTLGCVSNLAGLLYGKGDYAGAEPLLRRALDGRERVLGPEHPDTLGSVGNLAALLDSKGDYAGAAPLYRRALESSERVLGAEHPDTLVSVNNLAALLYGKGDYEGAEPLCRRALEASERVLGAEHPDALLILNNLAEVLSREGDYAGAEPLCRRALEASERVLGAEHPDTLGSVSNLAVLLSRKGDYAGAGPLYRRALLGFLRISRDIGRAHPNLQPCVTNYAGCLRKLGHSQEEIHGVLNQLMQPFGFGLGGPADASAL